MPEYIEKPGRGTAVKERPKEKTQAPRRYKVLLHNDHYTTMDFVVMVLKDIFRKPPREARRIMLQVHHEGIGIAGVYPREIAETKVDAVHELARANGFPLRCSLEAE